MGLSDWGFLPVWLAAHRIRADLLFREGRRRGSQASARFCCGLRDHGCFGSYPFQFLYSRRAERLTTETAHQAGLMAAAVIYLMLFDRKRWVRRASVVLLLLMMVLLLRAQMLTPLLTSLLAMALFFSFSRKFAVFVGCAVAGLILVAASFYSVSVT